MRRHAAVVLTLLFLCGTGLGCRPAEEQEAAAAASEPVRHLVLITIDTLRADALGFAGNSRVATPAIDRLAAAGRVFSNAHSHAPQTLPAHASILTGLYPYQHGVRQNGGFVLASSLPTLATRLAAQGFATAAFVAAYPLDAEFGLDRGFAVYDDDYPRAAGAQLPERRGDEVVARALAWWDAHAGPRRFLWLHLFDPHHPYDPPEPFASRYADDPYLGEVAATDAFLAPLLDRFLAGGEAPSLVVLVADHGEGLGEHGEARHGLLAYETTLKTTLVLWRPGLGPGRDDRLARHVDVLPTALEALGLAGPGDELPGRSLLRPPEVNTVSYFEALAGNLQWDWAPLRGVIRGGKKVIEVPLPELYDLRRDPGEATNLVQTEGGLARQLLALLPAESAWPPAAGEISPEVEANLRSLGYLGGPGATRRSYGPADDPKNLIEVGNRLVLIQELQISPLDPPRGTLQTAGRLAEAVRLAEQVVARAPSRPQGYDVLSELLLALERPREAVAVMRQARDRGVASDALTRRLGLTLAAGGELDEAFAVLRPLAERGDVAGRVALADVLIEAARPQDAATVLDGVLADDPDNARAHASRCNAALSRSRWAAAREDCRRAVELDERLSDAWNSLGVARYYLGEGPAALAAWERAVELDPTQYDTLYNLGMKGAELGEHAKARDALARFLRTAPPGRYARDLAAARVKLRELGG